MTEHRGVTYVVYLGAGILHRSAHQIHVDGHAALGFFGRDSAARAPKRMRGSSEGLRSRKSKAACLTSIVRLNRAQSICNGGRQKAWVNLSPLHAARQCSLHPLSRPAQS